MFRKNLWNIVIERNRDVDGGRRGGNNFYFSLKTRLNSIKITLKVGFLKKSDLGPSAFYQRAARKLTETQIFSDAWNSASPPPWKNPVSAPGQGKLGFMKYLQKAVDYWGAITPQHLFTLKWPDKSTTSWAMLYFLSDIENL